MKATLLTILTTLALCSCSQHFISDRQSRQRVAADFESRAELLDAAGICIDEMSLDNRTAEALQFLYAYMPLGDLLNQKPEFWVECCRYTDKAMLEMPWGKSIPEREIRHFVLPPRVNNENLDGCRPVFYEELAPRVKDLSLGDAILEVNHWCHEKVSYKPSDSRTSAPLATIRTAYGRCGEESTLLVAALRSVGIPARQVYTPRWAHTDDNHAWVEAWVDGSWHFLGACEPEAVLDLGWFNAPASRGMLMNTNVFGYYDGPEEKLEVSPLYTRINVVSNYAPQTRRIEVEVTSRDGKPAAGAQVGYKIYNYAEFYSVATLTADADGRSGITVGMGDLLVYASDADGNFGFAKAGAADMGPLKIELSYNAETPVPSQSLSIVPPPENASIPDVDEQAQNECKERLAAEDEMRNAYIGTFRTAAEAAAFAEAHGLDAGRTVRAITASCGNYEQIEALLAHAAEEGRGDEALTMLRLVSEKDLRDTPAEVFIDHLDNCATGSSDKVLNPRIYTELLRPWRSALRNAVSQDVAALISGDPAGFVTWCANELTIHEGINNSYTSIDPAKVWKCRICDKISREIFFIAACRSFGVEAWKDPVDGAVRYRKDGTDFDVDFEALQQAEPELGTLVLHYEPEYGIDDPKYYSQFSISAFDGRSFHQLEFGEEDSWRSVFKDGVKLAPGLYVLCTGMRLASGQVDSGLAFFRVQKDETVDVEMRFNFDPEGTRVIGSFDSESRYIGLPDKVQTSVLATTGRGYFAVLLLDALSEPCVHAAKDLEAAAAELEAWGRPILLLFRSPEEYRRFAARGYSLPSTVRFGIDECDVIRGRIAAEMKLDRKAELPYVLVADTFNRVVFFSSGYTIGLGDQLLATAKKL